MSIIEQLESTLSRADIERLDALEAEIERLRKHISTARALERTLVRDLEYARRDRDLSIAIGNEATEAARWCYERLVSVNAWEEAMDRYPWLEEE